MKMRENDTRFIVYSRFIQFLNLNAHYYVLRCLGILFGYLVQQFHRYSAIKSNFLLCHLIFHIKGVGWTQKPIDAKV